MYIRLDQKNNIIAFMEDVSESIDTDIYVDSNETYEVMTSDGCARYKYEDGQIRERNAEERASDWSWGSEKERYDAGVVSKIRVRYSTDDENKIVREALASGSYEEFDIYNAFVEQCKTEARLEVYGE